MVLLYISGIIIRMMSKLDTKRASVPALQTHIIKRHGMCYDNVSLSGLDDFLTNRISDVFSKYEVGYLSDIALGYGELLFINGGIITSKGYEDITVSGGGYENLHRHCFICDQFDGVKNLFMNIL